MSVALRTSREWARALAVVHPDGPTPNVERFIELTTARDRWIAAQRRAHGRCRVCGLDAQHGTETCSPLCARELARRHARPRVVLALKPAPRIRYCEAPGCGHVLKTVRYRHQRGLNRFCNQRCAAKWLQANTPREQLRRQGRRAAALNKLRAKLDVANKFRHLADLDERVRQAYKAGYQAGYQARVRERKIT